MSESTKIQWTDKTWNPWMGCTKVHARCKNCYMFRDMTLYGRNPSVVVRSKTTFNDPLKWQKKAEQVKEQLMVFTCSWSDWFHVTADAWRNEAWDIVRHCPNITFQILTKRPDRIADHLPYDWGAGYENVWLGSSLDPKDEHGMDLFEVPAHVRFLSLEPLLAPVEIPTTLCGVLNWIICGGESGRESRPCDIQWVRDIIMQCQVLGIPCFVKQLGSKPESIRDHISFRGSTTKKPDGFYRYLNDRKGGDPSEWPDDVKVRQFPK